MGGKIDVQSEYGSGSEFVVHIPQKKVGNEILGDFIVEYDKTSEIESRYTELFTAPDAEILVVDDNSMNLMVISKLLKKTLVKITTCSSGYEALELMEKQKYDVVFLDHMMPDMDGIETLHNLKNVSDHININTPFIALTANAISGVRDMYISEGFNDYLSKPVDAVQLEEMLSKYIPDEKKNVKTQTTEPNEHLIDSHAGISNCGNMKNIYRSTLELFCSTQNDTITKLNNNISENDWRNYTVNILELKLNAYNIGCKKLGDICLKLELTSKNIRANINKNTELEFVNNNHNKAMKLYSDVCQYIRKELLN